MMKLIKELKMNNQDTRKNPNKDVKEEENNYEFDKSETYIARNKLKTNHINS